MRAASTSATAQAKACSRIRGANSSRRSEGSFLESSNPTMRRRGFKITAAATTGPKREPRPASSNPAIRSHPRWRASRSYREEQSRPPIGRRFYHTRKSLRPCARAGRDQNSRQHCGSPQTSIGRAPLGCSRFPRHSQEWPCYWFVVRFSFAGQSFLTETCVQLKPVVSC